MNPKKFMGEALFNWVDEDHSPYLLLKYTGPKNRKVYFDFLAQQYSEHSTLLKDLLALQAKYLRSQGRFEALGITSLNEIYVPRNSKVLKQLLESKLAQLQNKRLILKEDLQVIAHLTPLGSERFELKYRLENEGFTIDLKETHHCSKGPPHWVMIDHTIHFLQTEIPFKWLLKDQSEISLKEKESLEDLVEDLEDPLKIVVGDQKKVCIEPILKLLGPSYAFANLYFNYGSQPFLYQHPIQSGRDLVQEKEFEQDLIESGFEKKVMGTTHYFCPLDQLEDALNLLIGIGWRVEDMNRQQILLPQNYEVQLVEQSDAIALEGEVAFEGNKVSLDQALKTSSGLLDLGNQKIGVLPKKWLLEKVSPLFKQSEKIGNHNLISKDLHGLCHSFASLESKINVHFTHLDQEAEVSSNPSHFKGELRSYQERGVTWLKGLYQKKFSGLLADDMGLGKTVQVIAFLSQIKLQLPVLIVAPTSLLSNWMHEIKTFYPKANALCYSGPDRRKGEFDSEIIVTSYALLRQDFEFFQAQNFAMIFLDEAQTIKNQKSQILKRVCEIRAPFKLSITGTPIENSYDELIAQFMFLMPNVAQKMKEDLEPAQVRRMIDPFILRRTKKEVLTDLPEKIEQTIYIEMDEPEAEFYSNFIHTLKGKWLKDLETGGFVKNRMKALELLLRLRQWLCHPDLIQCEVELFPSKFNTCMQDIETALKEGHKVVLFSQFVQMLQIFKSKFNDQNIKHYYLDGQTQNRDQQVQGFQNDKDPCVFLISLKAGGVGLNLTAADCVMIYDPWFNEAVENQAIDRAHRIGRKGCVLAKRYLVKETVEEKMQLLKNQKKQLFSDLFEEGQLSSTFTEEDFNYLFDTTH